jgi:NADPH:quinone reductase-like Zn-dependent oxidoreductase
MTVIGIKAPGGPDMLVAEERAVVAPGEGEILVKVAAAGVNRPDVMQRQGNYPPPPGAPDIPGLEIAGEIVALGAYVITTAGAAEKCEACRKLGADVAVNYKTEDFVAATKAATGGKGADVILDMVGGDYIARNYEAAAVEGRIVQIAFQGGPKSEVNFMRLMLKRLHHTGSTLRARSVADKGTIRDAVEKNALPLIVAGKVKPVIYKTFPLAEAAAAHALMESSAHIGKILLTL